MKLEFYPKSLFTLEKAYKVGSTYGREIADKITGRACGMPHDYGLLSQVVFNAGDGDYVETGTFYGASAIVAALIKKDFELKGKVVCIDPLKGFYGDNRVDGKTKAFPTKETVIQNALKFGVASRLEFITEASYPFPKVLENREFNVAYIDGDHWGDLPYKDWINLKDRTSRYIIFDNYDSTHPSVIDAVEKAIVDKEWTLVHQSSISAILEKTPQVRNTFRSKMVYEERH